MWTVSWFGALLIGYTSELLLQLSFYLLSKVKLEKTVKAVLVRRWAAAFLVLRSSGSFSNFDAGLICNLDNELAQ